MTHSPTPRLTLPGGGPNLEHGDTLPFRVKRVPLMGRYVTLDPLAPEHIADLWPLARETPEQWRWLTFGPFTDFATFNVYTKLMLASQAEVLWCVRVHGADGQPGAPSGWIALLDIRNTHAALELGNIWFPEGLAGTRAATEALALLLGYVFDELGYRRVAWKCDALHLRSRCCAERLGFSHEGTLRAHMIVRGKRRDSAYYSLLREEWPDRRAALAAWLDPMNFDAGERQINRLRRAA